MLEYMKKKICNNSFCFSSEVIKRLSIYARDLKYLYNQGITVVSSSKLAKLLGISPSLFRKDLSYFGEFGKRGVGYDIKSLIDNIEKILLNHKKHQVVIVGIGKLGKALLQFPGFLEEGFDFIAGFDINKEIVGSNINNIPIRHINELPEIIKENNISLGIICVPCKVAQDIADILVKNGIRGILNFAPIRLKVPRDIFLTCVDMAVELKSLNYYVKNNTSLNNNRD